MRRVSFLGVLAIVALLGLGLWALLDMNDGKLPSLDEIADGLTTSQGGDSSTAPSLKPGGAGVGEGTAPDPGQPSTGVATPPIPADAGTAVVRYVHDGDTLFLQDGRKVRLLGIDTPEVGDNLECYGNEARDALRALLPEGTTVRTVADVRPTDQYDRSLLFLFTEDGRLVNLDLIRSGYAEAVVYRPNVLWQHEVQAAEDEAHAAGVGMWSACGR